MDALGRVSLEWTIKDDIFLCYKVLKYVQGRTTKHAVTRSCFNRLNKRRRLTFEQDLTLCREVVCIWWKQTKGTCAPPESFFAKSVVGQNPLLEGIDGTALHCYFKENLLEKLQGSILSHNNNWSTIKVDFGWLKRQHNLQTQSHTKTVADIATTESPMKKLKEEC